MTTPQLPDYAALQHVFDEASLSVTPAELHGLLSGMLAAGLYPNDQQWQPLLYDYTNDGFGWPNAALSGARDVLQFTVNEMKQDGFQFSLLLPAQGTEQALFARAEALTEWVNHFISGLGLMKINTQALTVDSKEALSDLEEIARLGIDEDDDLDEQADLLEQVFEHVKICVLTIHAECGAKEDSPKKPTIH